ncbi:uncharacterized protein LOC102794410 [Neolamprologus brichardi]|uniref:uncharacterized protein LOC102794410 n=1 Tax=Neolamprologus brichardi TaxID=32507 RepID=UPI0003EC1F35|nr:uncharacterized protein LOC102794410 [Neolamprologus brichardi]
MKMMMIVLLLLISQHASGVEVYEGKESVLLPCQVPADVSRSFTAAVWKNEELRNPTVHLRRQKSDDLSGQNNVYKHRTSMRVDALQTGDLSLTLRKPTVSDSGNYTCIPSKEGEVQSETVVQLKVTEPPPPSVWPIVVAAVLVTLVILAVVSSPFVCCAYKRIKDSKALLPEVVEVPQGEESVLLPFKATADLPQDVTVEWTLTQPKEWKVHVYQSGNNLSDEQDQRYRGRTEMKDEDPLRTKDFSLTLKPLHLTDSGVYTCTISNKDERVLLQKVVILSVRAPQPEVVNATDADESALLPFTTTAGLRQDVTVEWTVTEPTKRKVHVYESGNNLSHQDYKDRTEMKDKDPLSTKDLSLTLKHPRLDDSRSYTCTVYDKDGHMLLQKVVTLRVRESLPDIVQAVKGAASIELPLKTTADLPQDVTVKWKLTQPKHMMVHVYESGNNLSQPDYKNRTEMKKDPLSTKDLSLTLKHPHFSDTGVYTCTVSNKDGDTLLQKSVTLHATDDPVTIKRAVYGDKSYLLEFNKTEHRDVSTVEWKLIYPKYKLMKKIPNHQGSEVDFSLNLEDLQLTDSGVYTCTTYKEDGRALLQRSVTLSVRDFQMEVVEVPQGEESVLLPFKTTADLHHVRKVYWMFTEHEIAMVDVYESEPSNQQNKQHQRYRGRTKMEEDPLRTGDLSLTLKHPRLDDSRSYTCTVYNKDDRVLLQKVVILKVRPTLKGIMADMLPRTRRPPKQEPRNTNHEDVPLMAVHSA